MSGGGHGSERASCRGFWLVAWPKRCLPAGLNSSDARCPNGCQRVASMARRVAYPNIDPEVKLRTIMNKQFTRKFPGQAGLLLILISLFGLGDLGRALAEDDSSIVEYQNINSDSGQVVPGRVEWVGGGDDQRLAFVPYYVLPNGTNSSPPPSTPPAPSPAEVPQPRSGENLPAQGGGFPSGYDDPSTPIVPKLSSNTSSTDTPQIPGMPTSGRKPQPSTDSSATTDQPAWPPTPAMRVGR